MPPTEEETSTTELEPEQQSYLPYPLGSLLDESVYWEGDGRLASLFGSMERRQATVDDVQQMPITYSIRTDEDDAQRPLVYTGFDQGSGVYRENESLETPDLLGDWRGYEARYGRLNDGAGPDDVKQYFTNMIANAGRNGLQYYTTAPEIRLVGSYTAGELQNTIAAVQALNAALPDSFQVAIGAPLPSFNFDTDQALDNVIHVEFVDYADYPTGFTAWAQNNYNDDNSINYSRVFVKRDVPARPAGHPEVTWARAILHELVHAIGFYGHVSSGAPIGPDGPTGPRYQSIIGTRTDILAPVDREALKVLYDRLVPSGNPTDFSDFGPWTSESVQFHANGRFVGFGVALRNGYAEPWAYGYLAADPNKTDTPWTRLTVIEADWADSEMFLADNLNLEGTVTWTGSLLGVSPLGNEPDDTKRAFASVAGDAQISVNLDTLTGQANFTNLEAWDPDPNAIAREEWAYFATPFPGEAGTGRTWGDGDLNYGIAVQNNVFKQTGGDAGVLSGHFTGHDHEGAAGTLERPDLTAAFGAER